MTGWGAGNTEVTTSPQTTKLVTDPVGRKVNFGDQPSHVGRSLQRVDVIPAIKCRVLTLELRPPLHDRNNVDMKVPILNWEDLQVVRPDIKRAKECVETGITTKVGLDLRLRFRKGNVAQKGNQVKRTTKGPMNSRVNQG